MKFFLKNIVTSDSFLDHGANMLTAMVYFTEKKINNSRYHFKYINKEKILTKNRAF